MTGVQGEPPFPSKHVGGSLERVRTATVNLQALTTKAVTQVEFHYQVSQAAVTPYPLCFNFQQCRVAGHLVTSQVMSYQRHLPFDFVIIRALF